MAGALQTAHSIYDEAARENDPDVRQRLAKWAVASEQRPKLEAMVTLARAASDIRVERYHETYDRHPELLACENGVVDLTTGQLRAHDRSLRLTKHCPVVYDPTAKCPALDAFLAAAFEHDGEMISYLDRVLGYCLTGFTLERALFLLIGEGRNGKTTIAELMKKILGDAAQKVAFETFQRSTFVRSGSDAAPDIAMMHDKRFVWAVEAEEGASSTRKS